MANAKKKQDDKNFKILRELAALPNNKQCFECHQRGPTYVDMTVGSFVCTSCSGLLRGLNPPHRVKSISMATFTVDEIAFIKSKGNEVDSFMCFVSFMLVLYLRFCKSFVTRLRSFTFFKAT
ncbi:unnamed protein product [Soboliphyme baturini]|uniref:Arf-GAP domain-containing protein n=1 Tax=Soboliphyme baturini TaxID=241478 RepID=A0A183IGQ7_9BILA|nr:unnamed protein product [Soboliphyme baturini]